MTRFMRTVLALGLAFAAAPAPAQQAQAPGVMTIDVLDVGQGDAILIRSPEGKTALVDAGPSLRVVEALRERGITALDLVVVSHHHADQYGGMAAVVKAFNPRVFLASDSAHTTPHYLKLLELVRGRGIRAIGPTDAPRRIELGSVVLTVFPQRPEDAMEENNNSIGLRVQHGAVAVLLPGGAERAERAWWMRNVPELCAGCAVLKLAHHGSRNGTKAAWLELVRPKLAVASLGKDNEFGHPHLETVALLARMGLPLLRTDEAETITIRSNGKRWQVIRPAHVGRGPPAEAAKDSGGSKPKPHGGAGHRGGSVDLHTASEEELRTLPGVGPVIARRIITGRPYWSVEDLGRVGGIGPKRLVEIRPYARAD